MRAYRHQCALRQIRHGELLDAAHITPDSALHGEPVVISGISLCRLHHLAFDQLLLGVHPGYVIHIRSGSVFSGGSASLGTKGSRDRRMLRLWIITQRRIGDCVIFRRAIHPGEILKDELTEFGVTPTEFARQSTCLRIG